MKIKFKIVSLVRINLIFCFFLTITSCQKNVQNKDEALSENLRKSSQIDFISLCGTKTTDLEWYSSGKKAPKLTGLGDLEFIITTQNPEAQEYFNQGLMLSYGFNHGEAARSFFEATRLDENCAMCFWGFSYVLGPNYNAGMEPDNFGRAYTAMKKAVSLKDGLTEKEQQLIHALSFRYAESPPEDRSPLDIAYQKEMKKVFEKFPADPDIGALYAESIMDLHPWDLYEMKTKKPKEWTPDLINLLEKLIEANPNHPGAHHFYIHAVEASATPEKGLESAAKLPKLVPGAGHLVHMPAHIYINTGDYHLGSLSNLAAIEVDSLYVTSCHAQGVYPLAYYPHNYHFLTATATLEGDSKVAWMAAKKLMDHTAKDLMLEPGWGTLQHYYTIPYYVAVKFSMWDTLLSTTLPNQNLIYPRGVLHYARGLAHAEKNDLKKAEEELSQLIQISKDSSLKTITIWEINSTYQLIQIAAKVLSAKIYEKKDQLDTAIALLREAVQIEDSLNYNEPPDWFFSVRHPLGATLYKAGKYRDAEKIYLEDLEIYPENGWALDGLYKSLEKQGKNKEAEITKTRFEKAWKYADIML